jgi:septum site-determining protein MinD
VGGRVRRRPRSISITSGKGGTGKTTLTANLGIALATLGKRVTILDADLAMANLALIMGIHHVRTSFLDVLRGKAKPEEAIHENHGVRVLPAGFRFEEAQEALAGVEREQVRRVVEHILGDTDFLLIDAPAGVQDATLFSIASASEMLPVCNPTYTSLVDVYKIIRFANVMGAWTRGLVVNRAGKRAELPVEEIEEFLGRTLGQLGVIAQIPEDPKVQEAELEGVPVVVHDPDCPASVAIHELAELLAGKGEPPGRERAETVSETTNRLVRVLTGRA